MSEIEKHVFQAEITQLMSLIINTFYSNKDVFLRELVSNSSDALDKYKHFNLLNNPIKDNQHTYEIKIIPDKENKILRICDSGIGMTKDEMIKNIGTIAQSGTKQFMQAINDNKETSSLIGQFGVGFYSAFLVSTSVSVISKTEDGEFYKWESSASDEFTISKLENGIITPDFTLEQGTVIECYLKDDCYQFLEYSKIRELIKMHNQYLLFPINMMVIKEESKEIEIEEDADTIVIKDDSNVDDNIVIEDVKEENEKKSTKTVIDIIKEYELLNSQKPIWCKSSNEITDEDANGLYKSLTNDANDAYCYKHIIGEGQIEYKGMLFLPKQIKNNVFERGVKQSNIKLYVRKIFITDRSESLCPEWLHFISGMIDTDDLPLNISREMLQENKVIKILKKAIIKKSIDMLKNAMNDMDTYKKIYDTYYKNIKLGVYEESNDRERIADLLMYKSSENIEKEITLDDYITNAPDEQESIYYITGDDAKVIVDSPFLDRFKKQNINVLIMTDPVDEYMIQKLTTYKSKKLVCITKGEVFVEKDEKDTLKNLQDNNKSICDEIKKIYSDKFMDVKITNKISDKFPCVITAPEHGFTANMEKIVKSQTLGNDNANYMINKHILEINIENNIMLNIKHKLENLDEIEKQKGKDLLDIVVNCSLIYSGYSVFKPTEFSSKLFNILKVSLDIDDDTAEIVPDEIITIDTTIASSVLNEND